MAEHHPESVPCSVSSTHHIGIAVKDLEATVQVYREVFGLEPGPVMEAEDYHVRGVFISTGNMNIELVQATSPESTIAKFVETRGEGLHHVCFEVEDIHGKLEKLKSQGIRVVDQAPRTGLSGGLVAFLHPSAARGVLVELAQHGR